MGLMSAFLSLIGRRKRPAQPDPIEAFEQAPPPVLAAPPPFVESAAPPISDSPDLMAAKPAKPKSPLVILVGASVAAALAVMIPHEESGRKVEATVTEQGELQVRHVRGPQYLKAYADVVGVWTICDGDTKNVRPGMVETEAGCRNRLEQQLIAHASPVLRCVPDLGKPEREKQLIASVLLAYNIGTGGFCRSTAARRFNAGNWRGGCDAFLMWNKAGGREVRGLTLRRQRERAICLEGL